MQSFIPHKSNENRLRKIVGIFVIVGLSAAMAHFSQSYFEEKEKAVIEEKIVTKENNTEIETENKSFEKVVEQENVFPVPDVEQVGMTIEEAQAQVPIVRNQNPKTKMDEAKKFTKPQIMEGKYIDVSIKYQNMVLFENGKVVDAFLISSGKKGMETPLGTFKIENKAPRAYSKAYGLYMPSWMAIEPNGKYGIHELPEWPGGYKEGENHLGVAVSHGCIRLGVGAAKRVFDWAEIGTPIIIHN